MCKAKSRNGSIYNGCTGPKPIPEQLPVKHHRELCECIEIINHSVSICPMLTLKEYKDKHDKIEPNIHWKKYQYYRDEKCYEYYPERVIEDHEVTIFWDFTILVDKHM